MEKGESNSHGDYAFIDFKESSGAIKAQKKLQNRRIGSRHLIVLFVADSKLYDYLSQDPSKKHLTNKPVLAMTVSGGTTSGNAIEAQFLQAVKRIFVSNQNRNLK